MIPKKMMALINGEFGWLMYLREDSDAGFSSRNPIYTGSEDETMEFYLSNGQLDRSIKLVMEALDILKSIISLLNL